MLPFQLLVLALLVQLLLMPGLYGTNVVSVKIETWDCLATSLKLEVSEIYFHVKTIKMVFYKDSVMIWYRPEDVRACVILCSKTWWVFILHPPCLALIDPELSNSSQQNHFDFIVLYWNYICELHLQLWSTVTGFVWSQLSPHSSVCCRVSSVARARLSKHTASNTEELSERASGYASHRPIFHT